ncbi:amiloride-sensitive amine oxidase [copper-containing] isoform X2 [Athene cunicularia]|uniref:amiloride-sensitive amine oxidase [copper-containing] isoform X2 n=1 Tax=Athene cunicularia TaxID=194338 RepID=UPI000EF6AC22|nr:amiloride-sensitive amine oxidase [copper-containing] isoform X2 [Athene cunicularia]
MWLLRLAWALAALSIMASSGPSPSPGPGPTVPPPDKASIFADLSPAELRAVRTFLMSRPELGLSLSRGGPLAKNTLFLVELLPPKKRLALRYLDQGGPQPRRQARAVIFFGGQAEPNVTEFAVGPLPQPSSYRPLRFKGGRAIPFDARPMTQLEYELLHRTLVKAMEPLYRLLRDSTGFWYHNCSQRCLTFSDIAPRGLAPGERRTWMVLQRFVEGFFLHPVGLEVLVDHRDPDPGRWAVQQLWYNGQYFSSPQELARRYEEGTLVVAHLAEPPSQQLFSSYEPRGHFATETPTEVHGAKVCEPQGRRYRLRGNQLEYGGWSLAFRLRSSAGLQLFDLRFNGERVAYEVSVQEAIAFYGGHTPAAMQTKYMDAGWGMGSVTYELARGIDCPEVATYLDAHHLYDADGPVRFSRAICIFELPTGVPLRRHFDSDFQGGFHFYAGLEGQALVLRTTSTVYNYDYIWDFLLYPNGVMEAKVHATGFIHATFYTPQGLRYGSRVHSHVLGNLHTHLVHYKVDLDIAGTGNSFETMDVRFENISNPWSPGARVVQPWLHRQPRRRERQAAFPFGKALPRYLLFYNPHRRNRWGHARSYRIQHSSHAGRVLPRGWQEEKGISWGRWGGGAPMGLILPPIPHRYHLAVTRHHENEPSSSSIYAQNDPWEPLVSFEGFLRDNETIEDQDLVAWVTVGFLHVPHAEDIPNTATPGNAVGFFLRPFNFFDEDPSVASRSPVIVRPLDPPTFSQLEIQRWTPASPGPCVAPEPFTYNGTYRQE